MKEAFIFWIIIQLIAIGGASTGISNGIRANTYECVSEEAIPIWFGYVVPLTAFVPETQEYLDYCHPYEPKLTKIK